MTSARMRLTRLLGISCIAFCAATFALSARAESAGKVLSADGDALVLRGSQILRLFRGAAVESGDQIHTGSDGKVLVVFTDSGLVWIRGNSDFVVDEYSYAQGRRETAFFSLLKGGARSVTGLIGRRTRSNFRLRIPVATIGIRGTDFSVVMCQRDCRDADGSTAAKGLYGEVIQGRIAVTPLEDRLLEREFGAGEFFHLADERSSPTPLFLPPPFLRSTQDEQARFTERTGIVIAPLPPILGGPGNGTGGSGGLPGIGGVTGILSGGLTGIGDVTGTLTGGLTRGIRNVLAINLPADLTGKLTGTLDGALASSLDSTLGNLTGTLSSLTLPLVGTPPPTTPIGLPGLPPITTPGLPPVGAPVLPPVGLPGTPITPPIGAPGGTPPAPPIGLPGGTLITPPIGVPSVPPIVLPAPITTGPTPGLPSLPVLGGH